LDSRILLPITQLASGRKCKRGCFRDKLLQGVR
jgi:hypothetical protein